MAEEEARFSLRIDADAEPTKEAAAALEKFRALIEKSQERVAGYRKSLSMLRGSSDEVAAAKASLRAAIAAEQGEITKNNLAILKLGGSYDKLQKAHKKSNEAFAAAHKAVQSSTGPLHDLNGRLEGLKEILAGVTSGYGLMAVAAVGAIIGLVALAAGAAGLSAKLTEWLVVSGDSLRNMQLMREAAAGGAKNATAWGHVIDWVSLKVATSKDQLNELALATERAMRGTRVSGKGMIDVFGAVAQSAAAMGNEAGRKIQDLLTRGKQSGRFGIGFTAPGISELQGTGVTFDQVAAQLAKNLNIRLDQARAALVTHAVTIDAGAKALRQVIEKNLGDINERKMLSLDALVTKLKDNIRDWAQDMAGAGGALEPLLGALKQVVDMFGLQSESGQKMKAQVTEYATALAGMIQRNLPAMKQMVVTGLELAGLLVHVGAAVAGFATSSTGALLLKGALLGVAAVAGVLVVAMAAIGGAFAGVFAGAAWLGTKLGDWASRFVNWWGGLAEVWKGLGVAIIDGLTFGLVSRLGALWGAVSGVADGLKERFKKMLGIQSPSKVFAHYGRMTAEGFERGVDAGAPGAQDAVSEMVRPEGAGGAQGAPGGAGTPAPTITIQFNISGTDAQGTAAMIQSESVLGALRYAIRTALSASGLPTAAPALSGG